MEGAEAGSGQAALDAAVQSAAAHVTVQLGPALLYTLRHGSGNKEKLRTDLYLGVCTPWWLHVSPFFAHVPAGDGSADLGSFEEDPRGVFSHRRSAGRGSRPHSDHLLP